MRGCGATFAVDATGTRSTGSYSTLHCRDLLECRSGRRSPNCCAPSPSTPVGISLSSWRRISMAAPLNMPPDPVHRPVVFSSSSSTFFAV